MLQDDISQPADSCAVRLVCIRKERGWSLRKAAANLGTSANVILRWETEESSPSLYFVYRICIVYDVSPTWLMFDVGPKKLSSFSADN
jgi:transcriptional regulator with XRE-family HTH domain